MSLLDGSIERSESIIDNGGCGSWKTNEELRTFRFRQSDVLGAHISIRIGIVNNLQDCE